MAIKIIDRTGTARATREIEESLRALDGWMMADLKDPKLMTRMLHYPTIRSALQELLAIRKLIEERRAQKRQEQHRSGPAPQEAKKA